MPAEFRPPHIIQEELSDLRAIIKKEEVLISRHKEHTELLLALNDSKKRENELINELEASLKKPVIIYKLEADSASLNNAPAQLVGKILVAMQGLIYSLAGSSAVGGRRSKREEDLYRLNVNFKAGSIDLEFSPALLEPTFDEMMTQTPVFTKASEFLNIMPQRGIDYPELKLELERQIDDPRIRIATLNALKQLIPPPGKKAEISFRNVDGDASKTKLDDDLLKRRVDRLLKEEIKKNDVEVFGVVSRIKDDKPAPSFIVKNWAGKFIKVQMPEERRDEILEYLSQRVPVRLKGAGNKRKLLEIFDLDEIEPSTRVFIDSIHDVKFDPKLEAELSYEGSDGESDYWVVGNDELGAYGVDLTVDKAKEMFKEDLYSNYLAYKDLDDAKLTEKAINLKKGLNRLFEG